MSEQTIFEVNQQIGENSEQAQRIRELEEPDEFHTLRVASAFQKSIEVLGSLDKARRWFTSPKRALGDKTPLEFCATDIGAEEVCNLLGRIEHGIFA
jgi:putative toxin-antitoxin system antitoxin component (TIGR02293 family)